MRRAHEEYYPNVAKKMRANKKDGAISVDWIGLTKLAVDKDADTQILWSHAAAVVHGIDTAAVATQLRASLGSSTVHAGIDRSG